MVMKLYSEFEPAIQFAKTVGEVEYAKLMELYTAWKSGAFSNSVELGTYYGRQSWDVDTSSWPSDLKDGDMFLGEVTGITYVYVASTNTFYPVSNGGYRGEYSAYEKYIVGQLVTDADGNLYASVGANIELQAGSDITGYSVGCALDNTTYWALLSSGSNSGGGGGALVLDAVYHNYCGTDGEFLSNTEGQYNIALGQSALESNTRGSYNTAIGTRALKPNIDGCYNVGVGWQALVGNTEGFYNVGIGMSALLSNTIGMRNVGVGANTLQNSMTGNNNTAVGNGALICYADYWNQSNNTAVGCSAGFLNGAFSNTTCLGYNSTVTGSNQVQLGNSSTTTYVYGTVQNRSDARDKADIVDSNIGLDFILGLRPVEGVWDLRDDYVEYTEVKAVDEKGVETVTLERKVLEKDGSKKRSRKHQWFIAQEVKELCDRLGVDFGGYQDHSVSGGADVLSLGYDEFIPPAVKAIQECWQRLDKLEERISKLEQ